MIRISVVMPTFRRPDSLMRAARSVFAQAGVDGIELICVDNSPEGSALDAFRALETEAPIRFRWLHEPRPGVAYARNAALPYARGELIAWLDDDEEAPPHWLAALIAVRRDTGAQAVFGPVRASAPDAGAHRAFFENLYSRNGPDTSGASPKSYGIGNSLTPRLMFDEPQPFDPAANETGGEDDALFAAWREAGAEFAWAAQACVTEHVGAERTRLAHGLKRAFAYGQGPCETAWAARDFVSLARHMLVGAAQALAYGVLTALIVIVSRAKALLMLDRAARGAGKVFWFREQRFYGEALAARQLA
jgi:glycosyltransferase involved in cell wall biosynthesis